MLGFGDCIGEFFGLEGAVVVMVCESLLAAGLGDAFEGAFGDEGVGST